MTNRCEHCPVIGPCIVESTEHRRFCEWVVSGDPVKRTRVIELSAGIDPMDAAIERLKGHAVEVGGRLVPIHPCGAPCP